MHGTLSDNDVSKPKNFDNSTIKVSKSDSKLFKHLNTSVMNKKIVRISNSMNDLSVIKTPKKDNSSNEDLQTVVVGDVDFDDHRPRERQRSSSLDMGRGEILYILSEKKIH